MSPAIRRHFWKAEPFEFSVRVCRGLHGLADEHVWEYYRPSDADTQIVTPAVHRVLEAARAWRKRFADLESFDVSQALKDAIDALDAPVERYTARQWDRAYAVWDHEAQGPVAKDMRLSVACLLAATLNAAERKV